MLTFHLILNSLRRLVVFPLLILLAIGLLIYFFIGQIRGADIGVAGSLLLLAIGLIYTGLYGALQLVYAIIEAIRLCIYLIRLGRRAAREGIPIPEVRRQATDEFNRSVSSLASSLRILPLPGLGLAFYLFLASMQWHWQGDDPKSIIGYGLGISYGLAILVGWCFAETLSKAPARAVRAAIREL